MKTDQYVVRRVHRLGREDCDPGVIYLRGELDLEPWVASFLCPCGCSNENAGAHIDLVLLRDHKPRWDYELHEDGTITFTPSILRLTGCRSHFFIRKSRVVWA